MEVSHRVYKDSFFILSYYAFAVDQNLLYDALSIEKVDPELNAFMTGPCNIVVPALLTAAIFSSLSLCAWLTVLYWTCRYNWHFFLSVLVDVIPIFHFLKLALQCCSAQLQQLVVCERRLFRTQVSVLWHPCNCSGIRACCVGLTLVVTLWISLLRRIRHIRVVPMERVSSKMRQQIVKAWWKSAE